ncbi:MAG: nucleotide exchange factor GrpE [Eubacteriales bacterium]|nr:nucleotide exchange factor GrpE [Eubacteriales bacterium]
MSEDKNIEEMMEETQDIFSGQQEVNEGNNRSEEIFSEDKSISPEEATAENAEPADEKKDAGTGAGSAEDTEEKASLKKDKKDEKIDELTDKYKRLFAEFDNFRKRTETEKAGMYAEGERAVLVKVLNIVDNFERALASVPEELKGSSYVEGMEKIYRSTLDTLKELGTEPIEAVGKEFDANLHNAVMHIEDDTVGENIVVEEFQKGYMFRDKVLRYSMVKVAN